MLEQMRRQGASIFIYLIFGLLIVIFVINFAPNTGRGSGSGCGVSSNAKVTVDGSSASETAYHIAYSSNQSSGKEKTYVALDALIRRELLAQAAGERGIRVTDDLVDEAIKKGNFFLGGLRLDLSRQFFDEFDDGTRLWNLRKFKGWVNSLNVSPGAYREEQKRGMEAALMAELLESTVRVSRDEALADYLYENNTVTYDVVSISPGAYRAAMRLGDADVQRFLAAHEDDVKARYKTDERTYKGVKPQVKLREILIAKAEPAAPPPPAPVEDKKDDKAAKKDAKKDDKPAAPPIGLPIEEAKAKLEAARAAIESKKETFEAAAKELATSDAAKANGGALGWRSVDNAQLGDKALNDAVKALKPGELTAVITTANGVALVLAEDKREGDLSYDQVKLDIATQLAKDAWSKEAAKRAALVALDDARKSGKNLDQLYDRQLVKPDPGNGLNLDEMMKGMTPEQQEQLLDQLRKAQSGKHGSLEIQLPDQPVAWYADGDGGGNSAGGGSGSAAGSGAGSGSGAAAPPVPPAPAPALEASKDVLPAFGDVAKPKVERLGPYPRIAKMPGIGASKEAAAALFEDLPAGGLATRVYEGDDGFVVLQLVNRAQPKVEEFDKDADHQIAMLRDARGKSLVNEWLATKCEALIKANKIKPSPELITERDDKGNVLPTTYRPCMYFSRF